MNFEDIRKWLMEARRFFRFRNMVKIFAVITSDYHE